jgi:hypothetical protein
MATCFGDGGEKMVMFILWWVVWGGALAYGLVWLGIEIERLRMRIEIERLWRRRAEELGRIEAERGRDEPGPWIPGARAETGWYEEYWRSCDVGGKGKK